MGQPRLAPGKSRYTVSLTTANVDRFRKLTKQIGLPNNIMSMLCDDAIRETSDLYAKMVRDRQYTTQDFFRYLGEKVGELFEEEVKESATVRQTRNKDTQQKLGS